MRFHLNRTWGVAGITAAVLAAGCGGNGDDGGSQSPSSAKTPEERLAAKADEIVETAGIMCEVAPSLEKFAKDFNMDTTDPVLLAQRFARGYDETLRARVEVACLEGLTGESQPTAEPAPAPDDPPADDSTAEPKATSPEGVRQALANANQACDDFNTALPFEETETPETLFGITLGRLNAIQVYGEQTYLYERFVELAEELNTGRSSRAENTEYKDLTYQLGLPACRKALF